MTFFQDNSSCIPASPKLPVISTGGNHSTANSSPLRTWQAGVQWIGPLRRKLDYSISFSGKPHHEDIEELCTELSKLMISALQRNASKEAWLDLNHALNLIQPYKEFLSSPSMFHYVKRLYQYYISNMEKLFDVPLLESLSNVFPHEVSTLHTAGEDKYLETKRINFIQKSSSSQLKDRSSESLQSSVKMHSNLALPNGRNPYALLPQDNDPSSYFKAKPLYLSTLSKYVGNVASETMIRESGWKQGKSLTVAAIDVDLPVMFENVVVEKSSLLTESEDMLSETPKMPLGVAPGASGEIIKPDFMPITGREAIELFLKHRHIHKVKFIYLNYLKKRHYSPYDLISVPKENIDKEHFIFSPFGVLHVYPDGNHSETLTLSEWNRNAVLWNSLSRMPFFKNYLVGKMLKRWIANIKWMKFTRVKRVISQNLLHAIPDFGSALLHVFRLIHELSEITFLPVTPVQASQYTIHQFEVDTCRMRAEAGNVLELFFSFSKKVVEATRKACFEQLKYYEHQVKRTKPLYSKESLYLQHRKYSVRIKNLDRARQITNHLPSFITLVDQAISVHLVALARKAITEFVVFLLSFGETEEENEVIEETTSTVAGSNTTKGPNSFKDGVSEIANSIFSAKFVFNAKSHNLEMQPSTEKFASVLTSTINNIFELMCEQVCSMHTLSSVNVQKRPGSAPPSTMSSGSSQATDLSNQSSAPSFLSDFEYIKNSNQTFLSRDREMKQNMSVGFEPSSAQFIGSSANIERLTEPKITTKPLPTKDEDRDGIMTPNMMQVSGADGSLGLVLGGYGLMGNFNPLDQTQVKEKMLQDSEIANALKKQSEMIEAALNEVSSFCNEYSWLTDIRKFTSTWSDIELGKWRGLPAIQIEVQLNLIKQWIEKVKNMDRSLATSNRLLYVNCSQPNAVLVPALNAIFKQLIGMILSHAKQLSTEVTQEVKEALLILENKDTDMKSFAAYTRKVTESVKRKDEVTKKVTYIRSLYEVVRMTYRQLSQEEEKLDGRMNSLWESFLFQLKDATSFVSSQRPIILKQLDDAFQEHYGVAMKVFGKSTTGCIVDPSTVSTKVLELLSQYEGDFQKEFSILLDLSQYHESICGEPYVLDNMKSCAIQMNSRQNLWKYINIFESTTSEWNATLFRKFNAQVALEKINEWKQMAIVIGQTLCSNDVVLVTWMQTLDKFSQELPLLHRMSREAMKTRHWKEMFTGMGESFEPGWTFTVEELLAYKPSQHANLINQIYHNASAEYSLEEMIRKLKKQWENRQFQLAKHIYVVKTPAAEDFDLSIGQVKNYTSVRNKDYKLLQKTAMNINDQEKDSETYILVGVDNLLEDLAESHVTLQGMLQSRHSSEVKADAEIWSDTLQQIEEIVNLWVSCQGKWMYLNRVFCGDSNLLNTFGQHSSNFQVIDKKYREFIQTMLQDPKVLSVLSRRHGHPSWRELQGETLRKHLLSCIALAEEILRSIKSLLGTFRSQFPRLYFLCDDDCVQLLGISRQPKALLPYVQKCFKGVHSLVFKLPNILNEGLHRNSTTSLDLELHSHRLQVTHLIGTHKEYMPLAPIGSHSDACAWLNCLEQTIRDSVSNQLRECIEIKLREDHFTVTDALEEVLQAEISQDMIDPTIHQCRHWILKYTSQVVLLSDDILWYRDVTKLLQKGGKKEDYEYIKKRTIHKLKQFCHVMQENTSTLESSNLSLRLQSILSALITQTAYHREVLKSLESNSISSTTAYEWQRVLKHSADIVDYTETDVRKEQSYIDREHMVLSTAASVGNCYIDFLNHREGYGYEYMALPEANSKTGVCVGTIITPITERCMLDLSLSVRLDQSTGLFGSVGVGKSLVVSQLAQMFGKQFINLTCSEHMTVNVLKRSLCGMVESGGWLCLDQAQRLPITVLSKLSQHIKDIQQAYIILKKSFISNYNIYGKDGYHKLKRSHSITTLHRTCDDETKITWKPGVSLKYLRSLEKVRFDDYDAACYPLVLSTVEKTVGSIIFEKKLLHARQGFANFLIFATNNGCYPNIPESLRSIYRPTCIVKPDIQKLTEVWLQASGFGDSVNLSMKLSKMYHVVNSSADIISIRDETVHVGASSTKMAKMDLNTLKSIISISSSVCNKLRSQQRSRANSCSGVDLPRSSRSSSISSSATSIGRSCRRSEIVLANHNEELAIIEAILRILPSKLPSAYALTKLKETLRNIFPLCTKSLLPTDKESVLADSIRRQMVNDGLQPSVEWIEKSLQLFTLLRFNQTVLLAGPAGAGKTTLFRLLAKALNALSDDRNGNQNLDSLSDNQATQTNVKDSIMSNEEVNQLFTVPSEFTITEGGNDKAIVSESMKEVFYQVDITNVFPNAYTLTELFGHFDENVKVWKQGLLVKILKDSAIIQKSTSSIQARHKDPSKSNLQTSSVFLPNSKTGNTDFSLHKWIVMDGDVLSSWVDNISSLLDGNQRAHMSNMDQIVLSKCTNILFETTDFASASPSITSRCSIIHCNFHENWRNIAASWLDSAYNQYAVARKTIQMWRELIDDLVPCTLKFLSQYNCSVLQGRTPYFLTDWTTASAGIREISSFLSILSSCLTEHQMTRNTISRQSKGNDDDVTIDKLTKKRTVSHSAGHSSHSGNAGDSQSIETGASSVHSRLDDVIPVSHHQMALNLFAFAFVWGFGGDLQENRMPAFDHFVKEAFIKARHDVLYPRYETVYDYFVDEEFGNFVLWEDRIDLRPRGTFPNGNTYIPVHQVERYTYLSNILLQHGKSALLVGEAGCGKTSLISHMLQSELNLAKISISPGLSAVHFQKLLEAKASPNIKQHNLGLMAHPNAIIASRPVEQNRTLFFLDDLACAGANTEQFPNETVVVQPTLELLRQVISLKGTFHHERLMFKLLDGDLAFISTSGLPNEVGNGLGRKQHVLSPRLTRNFVTLNFLKPTKEAILSIYHDAVQSWLEEFPAYSLARHYDLSQAIIAGAYDLYTMIRIHVKPSPRHPHYVFTLHDLSKIMQGLFLLTPRTRGRPIPLRRRGAGKEPTKRPGGGRQVGRLRGSRSWGDMGGVPSMMRTVVRLWLHECSRTFYDRLVDDHDRKWLSRSLFDILKKHFCTGKDERPVTPAIERVRIIKTPIPSGGGMSMAKRPESEISGSLQLTIGDEETDHVQSQSEFEIPAQQFSEMGSGDRTGSGFSAGSQVTFEMHDINLQKTVVYDRPSETSLSSSSTTSLARVKSDLSGHSPSALSSTKDLHRSESSVMSFGEDSLQQDDSQSEITGDTEAVNEDTTTSEEFDSRANTALTENDDERSAVTGYTTEIESVFESETTLDESSTTTTTPSQTVEKKTFLVGFADEPVYPRTDPDESTEQNIKKANRPQHCGGKPSRPGGAKLGVTFVPGLIDNADATANVSGPLIPIDQVLSYDEETTSIVFSRGLLNAALGNSIDSYCESTGEQLAEALKLGLDKYNENANEIDRMELVFFKQAVCHAARLSRILCMNQGGHALLVSSSRFSGRRSLVHLVAYLNDVKVYFNKSNYTDDGGARLSQRNRLRKVIKEASFQAGINDKKVAIVLEDISSNDSQCLDDLCALARNGRCPALYSQSDLAEVAAAFAPSSSIPAPSSDGSGRVSSQEKLDQLLEAYFAKVLSNIHIIIFASYPTINAQHNLTLLRDSNKVLKFDNIGEINSFQHLLKRFPDLLTRFSCVDIYQEWNHSSWRTVSEQFVKDSLSVRVDDMSNYSDVRNGKFPWSSDKLPSQQLYNLSHLLAYVHCDALQRCRAVLRKKADLFVNPLTLRRTVQIFFKIMKMVHLQQTKLIKRYNQALRKISEAENSLNGSCADLNMLLPQLDNAKQTEQSWKKHVEEERQEYAEARQRCLIEEENIERLEEELDELRYNTKSTFDSVNPMYTSALAAVESLSPKCIDEIKRYQTPPSGAVAVVTCLCYMFEIQPANWENGKKLISQDRFFENLEFYDKDHIPENIFYMIKQYVKAAEFQVDYVRKGSLAAAMLCRWIHAIYLYAKALRHLAPKLEAQHQAEAKLFIAQATLGSKRVRCNQIKEELDSKLQNHKNASQTVKNYEKKLKNLENKIAKAQDLMKIMQEHVDYWREEKDHAKSLLESAVGDSAISAACVTYYGPLGVEQRNIALAHWINTFKNGCIDSETERIEILSDSGKTSVPYRSGIGSASTFSKTETDSIWNDEEKTSTISSTSEIKSRGLLKVRDNLFPSEIISTSNEKRIWDRSNLLRNEHMRFNALRLYSIALFQNSSWCFVIDPDNQAEIWLNAVFSQLKGDIDIQRSNTDASSSFDGSRVSTTTSNQSGSLGIIEDTQSDTSSTSMSDKINEIDTESSEDTEYTVTISATATAVSEKVVSRTSTRESKQRSVKFQTEEQECEGAVNADNDDKNEELLEKLAFQEDEMNIPSPLCPLDQLWVCKATDPKLAAMLNSAMLHGAFTLVTHVEEAISSDVLLFEKSLLAARFTSVSAYNVHPYFRLFLSTNLSFHYALTSSLDTCPIPLHKLLVTDMSLDEAAVEEKLEHIVLSQERSEFEAQRRLMEADIFHLEEHMEQLHADLLDRVANTEEALLSDSTLVDALQTYKRDAVNTVKSLKETKAMQVNLMQRKNDIAQVAQHGRIVYNALYKVSMLNPNLYQVSTSQYIDIFAKCLKSRMRGRSSVSSGTPGESSGMFCKARVVELNQSFTEVIVTFVERKMFRSDVLVFITLLALERLVLNDEMSLAERDELIGVTDITCVEEATYSNHGHVNDTSRLDKPNWITDTVWRDVQSLEHRHNKNLAGLCSSISTEEKRWKEYLETSPVLLRKVPCRKLHALTLGQKAIIWKTLKPELMSKIVEDLNTSILGGLASKTTIFDLDSILPDLSPRRPCVFILPSKPKETCFLPSVQVLNKAKVKGIGVIERSACFDNDIGDTLENCMLQGKWLVLNSCQLAITWPRKFIDLLTALITGKINFDATSNPVETVVPLGNIDYQSSVNKLGDDNIVSAKTSQLKSEVAKSKLFACHPRFRLWLVTENCDNIASNLPTILIQHAEFITLETPKVHKDLLKKTYNTLLESLACSQRKPPLPSHRTGCSFLNRVTVPHNIQAAISYKRNITVVQQKIMLQLSYLHAVLLERINYGRSAFAKPYLWTDGEAIDALNSLLLVNDHVISEKLCASVFARNVTDAIDSDILMEIMHHCLFTSTTEEKEDNLFSDAIAVAQFSGYKQSAFHYLLQKPNFKNLGLHPTAEVMEIGMTSLSLGETLKGVSTVHKIERGELMQDADYNLILTAHERHLKRVLENLLVLVKETRRPQINNSILPPVMTEFYTAEVKRLNTVINILQSDISLCLAVIRIETEFTTDAMKLLEDIACDRFPYSWLDCYRDLFRYHSSQPLSQFIGQLDERAKMLSKYMDAATSSATTVRQSVAFEDDLQESASRSSRCSSATQTLFAYNLAVFTRPDMFLQSILFTIARSGLSDFHKYTFSMELVTDPKPSNLKEPSTTLFETMYLEGLYLHKATFNRRTGKLMESTAKKVEKLPLLRLTAEKKSLARYKSRRFGLTSEQEKTFYKCPVRLHHQENHEIYSSETVIIHIPIEAEKPKLCLVSGVAVTCSLSK